VLYKAGGHHVGRELRNDAFLCASLRGFVRAHGHPVEAPRAPDFRPVSAVSSVAVHPAHQAALVRLQNRRLPTRIVACLAGRPKNAPFLYRARDPAGRATTYGQALDFVRGGGGDLRRLGVRPGQVVAYCVPPGAGAVGALAFLAVGAQATAAPLAPTTTEPDAHTTFDQLHAKHLLLFEGVD
jgi:hypothetical protein